MKHTRWRLIALAGCLGVFACAHGDGARSAAVADARPVLRVGTSGDYAPFSRAGEGFDVYVARAMARDLGVRLQWVSFTWPTLAQSVRAESFDVAMSGVTWLPDRAVVGAMSRAVAADGACVLRRVARASDVKRVAVNRGGVLERWARSHFPDEAVTTVDDNLSLPELLVRAEVDAVVTDSFEVAHFTRPGLTASCEPARERKVYWVVPSRAGDLTPRIDGWLAQHEEELQRLRERWLGQASTWTAVDHLMDVLDRRLRMMPAVAAYKRANGLPMADAGREAEVVKEALSSSAAAGLEPASVEALFRLQIELAKAVQARSEAGPILDLHAELRPTLSRLGRQIVEALVRSAPELKTLELSQLGLLEPMLEEDERKRLLGALRQVRLK